MKNKQYTVELGESEMKIEFNDWVVHADGSVVVSVGETVVMAVATMGCEKQYPDGGLALRVDYLERNYARGAILGGKFNKREGRPTTEATLTSRIIDRTIRPFFPHHFNREVQVVCTVLSLGEHDPDMVAVNAACAALQTSSIPWEGPVGCIRVAQKQNTSEIIVNPNYIQREQENYADVIIAGTSESIAMIEVEGSEVANTDMVELSRVGLGELARISELYESIASEVCSPKKVWQAKEYSDLLNEVFKRDLAGEVRASLLHVSNRDVVNEWKRSFHKNVLETDATNKEDTDMFVEQQIKTIVRRAILDGERMDSRAADEVRPLYAQAGNVPGRQHGAGVFYRGDTRVLSVLTLGSLRNDVLHHHEMEVDGVQRFMHHYNFPSYSVGEVGRMGSPGRREIGHGNLALRGLGRMLPSEAEFPYAVRVVSEVMSSNGSTSMAATCGATLALLDGGVPMKSPVAGIACGLVRDGEHYTILTDIVGKEDYYGDMDFKVCGTRKGITAIQLDCKTHGLSIEMIAETLERSAQARIQVLDAMEAVISIPGELSPLVERIKILDIPQGLIGLVIGKGGATIKEITKVSGARVDIDRSGRAAITGASEAIAAASARIEEIVTEGRARDERAGASSE